MEASVSREKDMIIISISGVLNFDKVYEFKKKSLAYFLEGKVVFCLDDLDFVGSTGMSSFVETLFEISQENSNGIALCGVGLEYMRLVEPYVGDQLKVFNSLESAKNFFQLKDLDLE